MSSPAGFWAEPQPKSNLVNFSLTIWQQAAGGSNFNDFAENQLTKFRAVFQQLDALGSGLS